MNSIGRLSLQLKGKFTLGLTLLSTVFISFTATAKDNSYAEKLFEHLKKKSVRHQIEDLRERLDLLEQNNFPVLQEVNCNSDGSISAVLDAYQDHTAGLVIFIDGVCEENVVIDRDDVTIFGSSPENSSIQPPEVESGPNVGVTVTGADNVILENLTVNGGTTAVVATQSKLVVRNAVVNNVGPGLSIGDNSTAEITNTIIDGNGAGTGVLAFRGANVIINGNSLVKNSALGVFASMNSTIALTNVAADGITDLGSGPSLTNNRYSANARAGGTLHLVQTSISDDGTNWGVIIPPFSFTKGVYVQAGGTAFFGGGNSIQGILVGVDATNNSDLIFSVPEGNEVANNYFGFRCVGNVGYVVGFPNNSPFVSPTPPPPPPLPAIFSGNNIDISGCNP